MNQRLIAQAAPGLAPLFLILTLISPPAVAEEEETLDLFRFAVRIGGESAREQTFRKDEAPFFEAGEDHLAWKSADLNFNAPLGGTHLRNEGALLGYQFFAHASASRSTLELDRSFVGEDLDLSRGGIGFSALMLSQGRKLYAAAVFVSAAEEEESRDDPDLRYTGIGLGSFLHGSTLWIYGGAFTYQLGRGLVVPVFGGWSRLGPDWSLAGVVPFLIKGTYRPSQRWSLGLFVKAAGNRYGFDNAADDPASRRVPNEDEDLDLRLVQAKIGADFTWRASKNVSLVAEAGSLVARRLILSEGDEEIFSAEVEPGGYMGVKLGFTFGETLFDEAAP